MSAWRRIVAPIMLLVVLGASIFFSLLMGGLACFDMCSAEVSAGLRLAEPFIYPVAGLIALVLLIVMLTPEAERRASRQVLAGGAIIAAAVCTYAALTGASLMILTISFGPTLAGMVLLSLM